MLKRLAKKLGYVPDIQAAHQVEAMDFDRADADVQRGGDLAVGVPHRDHSQDLTLPRRNGQALIVVPLCAFKLKYGITSASRHGGLLFTIR